MPGDSMEKENLRTEGSQQKCFNCRHFQAKQWDIGYCQVHQVNVLRTYHCAKFAQRDNVFEGDRAAIEVFLD